MLKSFSSDTAPNNCRVSALVTKEGADLKLVFKLTGSLPDLNIPCLDLANAQRKDRLWEHTCFEIFFGQHGMPNYREFNLSTSGDWNVYSFSDYREGMRQDNSFNTLPFDLINRTDEELSLEITIDLSIFQWYSNIDIGVSAVLEQNNSKKSYWAVNHPKDRPDFHVREYWLKSF